MMNYKTHIPDSIKEIIAGYDTHIAELKRQIKEAEFAKEMYLRYKPYMGQRNPSLTRDFVRAFFKDRPYPIQTVHLIDTLYQNITPKEKARLVRKLSVIFSQMGKEGEITIVKRKGVKGNYYKPIMK